MEDRFECEESSPFPIIWRNIFSKLLNRIWNRGCEGFFFFLAGWVGIRLKITAQIIFERGFAFLAQQWQ